MKASKNIPKIIGMVLGILLFSSLIVEITYAFFTWRSNDVNISGSSECFTVNYTKGPNISNESVILFDESMIISTNQITIKNGMALTGVSVALDSSCNISGNLTISLTTSNINSAYITGNSQNAFKYVVASYDPSVYTTISTSSLDGQTFEILKTGSITSTDKITLVSESLSTTTKGYLVVFYVDGNLANNDAGNTTFSAAIDAVVTQVES